ncbi:MAG: SpoIIE family protein phosphatase [Acidimicrobiales bacterium]
MGERGLTDAGTGVESGQQERIRLEAHTAGTLQRIGAALVSELDLERAVHQVTDVAMDLVGAQFGAFFYNVLDGSGESYMLYALSGVPREAFADFPMPRNTAVFDPTFRGEGVIRLDDVTADPRYGQSPPYYGMPPGHLPVRSYLAMPVVSRNGDVLGGLFFGHAHPGVFTPEHEQLVVGIAPYAAIAIENARLYQSARKEREAAQRLTQRLVHIQSVSARLAGAKDVDEVAEVVVTGAQRALGCVRAALYVLKENGTALHLVRTAGVNDDWMGRWSRLPLDAEVPATEALRTRRLVTVQDHGEWRARYPKVDMNGSDTVALAVVPMALGRQVFGVASFGWDGDRQFGDDDCQFLEALAGHSSQALERARLYEVERETARTLQQSLLPPRTPEIPGMELGAVYRPGDRSVAVGGDFYDVFRLGPNRWGVAMGDVCGRGARAASRTALVRYTLRAVAGRGDGPTDALTAVNGALLAEPEADDRFCAAIFAEVEVDRCGAWVTLACAGHPRPVVVRRAGWIDVRGQPGTLVGVFDDLELSEDRVGLGPGDSLAFFTDGISEARNAAGEQFADEGLAETLLGATAASAEELAEGLRKAAVVFSGGSLGDDVAILVLRVPPDAADDPEGRLRSALGGEGADGPDYPLPHGGHTVRLLPPREARIQLPPHPSSAGAARRFLVGVLASWRMPELASGDAALLLSEAATNAILHARSPFSVVIRYDGDRLRIEVGDGSPDQPRPQLVQERTHGPGGRGLVLLERLATRWGISPTPRGKCVWFEVPAPSPA